MGRKLSPSQRAMLARQRRIDNSEAAFNRFPDYMKADTLEKNRLFCNPSETDKYDKLQALAEEIGIRVRITKREIFKIGELLTEAKRLIDHGNFKQWIEDNFDFSYATANNFMNVYKHCFGYQEFTDSIPSSVLYMISAPSFPDDLREYLFIEGDILKRINGDELQTILTDYKEGKVDVNSPNLNNLFKANRDNILFEHYLYLIKLCIDMINKYKKSFDEIDHPLNYDPKETISNTYYQTKTDPGKEPVQTVHTFETEVFEDVDDTLNPCVVLRECLIRMECIQEEIESLKVKRFEEFLEGLKI